MDTQLHIHRHKRIVQNHGSQLSWEDDVHSLLGPRLYHVIPFCANQPRIATVYTEIALFLRGQPITAEGTSFDPRTPLF